MTRARFIVAGERNLPKKSCLRVEWHQAVRTAEEVQTLAERATMIYYMYIAYHVHKGAH